MQAEAVRICDQFEHVSTQSALDAEDSIISKSTMLITTHPTRNSYQINRHICKIESLPLATLTSTSEQPLPVSLLDVFINKIFSVFQKNLNKVPREHSYSDQFEDNRGRWSKQYPEHQILIAIKKFPGYEEAILEIENHLKEKES